MSDQQVQGIDVSHYQGTVDWNEVRQSGHAFAFAKATQGLTVTDPEFTANWSGMQSAGILRGAYHFYEPGDDPTQQADFFLSVAQIEPGDLPPVLDIEATGGQSAQTIIQGIQTWLETVEKGAGVTPILYTSPGFWNGLGTTAFGHYPLWVAQYGVTAPKLPSGWSRWTFWQSSQTGTVSGVNGSVDLDVFDGTLQQLQALTRK